MITSDTPSSITPQRTRNSVLWILVGGMLFLRIGMHTGVAIFAPAARNGAFLIYEIRGFLSVKLSFPCLIVIFLPICAARPAPGA